MTSRERFLATIAHREPDHIPLHNVWTANYLPVKWRDQVTRIPEVLALGLDDIAHLGFPTYKSPEVWTRCWTEWLAGSRHPVLVKEYHTPKGTLRQSAVRSDDWAHGEDVPIMSFQHMSQGIDFLVSESADLEKLAYLFPEPTDAQIADFQERAREVKRFAQRQGVLLVGRVSGPGTRAAHLLGQLSLALKLADEPAFVEEVLAFFHRRSLRLAELVLNQGVDVFQFGAGFEMSDYWSVEPYRRLLKPLIREYVELAHQAGVPLTYWLDRGVMPLRQDFLDLGIDSLWGVDPLMDKADMGVLKREIGDRICLWGGICSAITLGRGTRREIREAVTEAIRIMGPGGGFVLLPVDQVFDDASWENVMIMVERWREIGEYPLQMDD